MLVKSTNSWKKGWIPISKIRRLEVGLQACLTFYFHFHFHPSFPINSSFLFSSFFSPHPFVSSVFSSCILSYLILSIHFHIFFFLFHPSFHPLSFHSIQVLFHRPDSFLFLQSSTPFLCFLMNYFPLSVQSLSYSSI